MFVHILPILKNWQYYFVFFFSPEPVVVQQARGKLE